MDAEASVELKLVEHLLVIVECQSISKAASRIGIAQPALGRQIEKLEQDCGVRLLYRHGRGVTLTPEGERFVEGMHPLLREMRSLVADLQADHLNPQGRVTVGLTPTMLDLFGLRLMHLVRDKYPGIKLSVVSNYSGYVHEWLTSGAIDIGLLHDNRRSKHITVDPLATAALHLVSAPRTLTTAERKATSFDLRQLGTVKLVLPSRQHGLRKTLESASQRVGIALNVDHEIDALPLLKEIVRCGDAHTVLAIPAVMTEILSGDLVVRKLKNPAVDTRLVLGITLNRPYTSAIRAVRGALGEALKDAVRFSPHPCGIRFTT